ncbi:MAG: hypothetical protein P8Y64_08870 [Gammaproteobacteria bacterium]
MNQTDMHMKEDLIGGSSIEAISGIGAVVLAIIGLAHLFPGEMLAISGIAVGAGLLFEGGSIAAEHKKLLTRIAPDKLEHINVDMGMSVELIGGLTAVVLGILSVLALDPMVLMPAAAIVVGTALILSSGTTVRMNTLRMASQDVEGTALHIAREAVNTSAMTQVFVGLGVVVLGILGLIGVAPMVLTLVAFLAIGASLALSGSAIGSRLFGAFKG